MGDAFWYCCRCCSSFIFTTGMTALFMWLSLRPSKPSCSIIGFYLPALNKTLNSTANTTLNVLLQLQNTNKDKGVYYDPIAISVGLYGDPNRSTQTPAANGTVPAFYQGHNKKAKKGASMATRGLNWGKLAAAAANRSALFRVNVTTVVRYKITAWKTSRHRLQLGADVVVNDLGTKDKRKGIKLKSAAPPPQGNCGGSVGLLVLFLLHL